MPMHSFVNPLPDLKCSHLLNFDYPVDPDNPKTYCATGCLPNIQIEPPGPEAMYGLLGAPKKHQGHPCICEYPKPEPADPTIEPFNDQTLDIDRGIEVYHTGRLSGSFVKYIADDRYFSLVKMYAHPIAPSGDDPFLMEEIKTTLEPGANAANVWFWIDPKKEDQLLYTAHIKLEKDQVKKLFKAENVYKLVCQWQFWDGRSKPLTRMPMSGFDEAVGFEVISATKEL